MPQLVWALKAARETGLEVVRSLASLLVQANVQPRALFEQLYPHASARSAVQREVVTAAVAQMAVAAMGDLPLTRHVLHLLLGRLADNAASVRLQALAS